MDDTRKETARRWKENGDNVAKKLKYKLTFDWHFFTAMRFKTTTTSGMNFHKLKVHRLLIGGSVGYLLSFWPSQRLMYF